MVCCPAASLTVLWAASQSYYMSTSDCRQLCGGNCAYVGQWPDNSCVACSTALSDDGCTDNTQWVNTTGAVRRPTGCVGTMCTFCNNSEIGALPTGAYINVVGCPGDTDGGALLLHIKVPIWNTVTLASRTGSTVHLSMMGAPSLQVYNDFTVDHSVDRLVMHDTTGPCAIEMSTQPANVYTMQLDMHGTTVDVDTQCGITIVSTHHVTASTIPYVKGVVHSVVNRNQLIPKQCQGCGCGAAGKSHFRGVAVANVAGGLHVGADTPVLLLQSQVAGFEFHGIGAARLLNLSNILGVFGTHYEVEYYNDGELYNIVDGWIWPTIQLLAASAIGLGGLYISNGNL